MVSLNYKTFGEGQPIVFLHGLFGMLDNWQTFGKRVAEAGYMVYLVDQRDHGKSPRSEDFNYALLAEDLNHFLEANWLYDAILVGHSMGGKTVLQYLKDYEDNASKAIIVDMGIKKYVGGHEIILEALSSANLATATSRKEIYDHIRTRLGDDEGTIQFLMKNLKREKGGGFQWKMNLPLLINKYNNILDQISFDDEVDTEVLFVRGSESHYVLDEDWKDIHAIFPNATLETIAGAGHWIHAQKPDELFDTISTFIAE